MSQDGPTHKDNEDRLNVINNDEDLGFVKEEKKINKEKPTKFLIDDSSSDEQEENEPSRTIDNDIAVKDKEDYIAPTFSNGYYFNESLTELGEEEEETEQEDEAFYLANRTFYTTCHKISMQNSPSFRKRPPYTFLENWMIHCIFSKSQQILLRFPVIQPKVMLTESDFIYTPHQQIDQNINDCISNYEKNSYYVDDVDSMIVLDNYQPTYNEDTIHSDKMEYDHYAYHDIEAYDDGVDNEDEEAFIIGAEDTMTPSIDNDDVFYHSEKPSVEPSSSFVVDENTWMGHSRYNNHRRLYVVNADAVDEYEHEDLLQANKEEHENDDEEKERKIHTEVYDLTPAHLTISPEVVQWYRCSFTSPTAPSTSSTEEHYQQQSTTEQQQQYQTDQSTIAIPSPAAKTLNINESATEHSRPEDDMSSTSSSCSSHSQHSRSRSSSLQSKLSHQSQSTSSDAISRTSTIRTIDRKSVDSYQSLADIILARSDLIIDNSSGSKNSCSAARNQSCPETYGTISTKRKDYVPLRKKDSGSICTSRIMQISRSLTDAAYIAIELAQAFHENDINEDEEQSIAYNGLKQPQQHYNNRTKKSGSSIKRFVSCMFDICNVLFSGVEHMVGWRSYTFLKDRRSLLIEIE